jgi:hypothetical protein
VELVGKGRRGVKPGHQSILKQAGKPAKVVIVACMRLLTLMNVMLKNNASWNPLPS